MFWHQQALMPESVRFAVAQTRHHHPDFELIFADDRSVSTYLERHYPAVYLQLYRANQIPASRSDLARLILLYAFGGIYLDAAMALQSSLAHWLAYPLVLIRRDDRASGPPETSPVVNSLLAVPARHPLIFLALEKAFLHLKRRQFNDDVWHATGAYCLNQALAHPYLANQAVQYFYYSRLLNQLFVYCRDPIVSNRWVLDQSAGILPSPDPAAD